MEKLREFTTAIRKSERTISRIFISNVHSDGREEPLWIYILMLIISDHELSVAQVQHSSKGQVLAELHSLYIILEQSKVVPRAR